MNKLLLFLIVIFLGIQPDIAQADGVFKIKSDLKKYILPHKVEAHATINDHLFLTKTKQFFKNTENFRVELRHSYSVNLNNSMYLSKIETKRFIQGFEKV